MILLTMQREESEEEVYTVYYVLQAGTGRAVVEWAGSMGKELGFFQGLLQQQSIGGNMVFGLYLSEWVHP